MPNNDLLIQEAAKLYLSGDYYGAAKLYAKVDTENPLLEINLGNSYYQLKSYGKSIRSYYEAKKIIPRNKEVNNNLSLVLNEIKLSQPNLLAYNGLSLFESSILFLVLNLLFIFKNKLKFANFIKVSIISLLLLSTINLVYVVYGQKIMKYAVITDISTKAYSGDNEGYSELFELVDGQIVEIVIPGKEWSQIKYQDTLGWVKNRNFDRI